MEKIKLFQFILAFDDKEWEKFGRFVHSPYFNQNDISIRLVEVIDAYYPDRLVLLTDKKLLHEQLFPQQIYEDKAVRYAMSDLCLLIESFFSIEAFQNHPYQKELILLDELSKKELPKAYAQQQRRIKKQTEQLQTDVEDFSLFQFQMHKIEERHFQRQRVRKYDDSVQQVVDALDIYYYQERLKNSCAMLDRQAILKDTFELNLSEHWLKHIPEKQFFNDATIQMYFTVYQMLTHSEDSSYFEQLKDLMKQLGERVNRFDLKEIYLLAINYCARKLRFSHFQYAQEALNLYKIGIEQKVLFDGKHLSPWTFTNVVKLSLKEGQYEWGEQFIKQYEKSLPPKFRENCMRYNLSELYYSTKQYGLAQRYLLQVVHSDLHYYLGARLLLAKIYYETQEEEALRSLLASFTIFLKRNKYISKPIKEHYLNFCTLLLKIVKSGKKRKVSIEKQIQETKLLADRAWLLNTLHVKK